MEFEIWKGVGRGKMNVFEIEKSGNQGGEGKNIEETIAGGGS